MALSTAKETAFHPPYISKRRRKVLRKKKKAHFLPLNPLTPPREHCSVLFPFRKEEREEHKTHFAFLPSFVALQHLGWEQLLLEVCNPPGHKCLTSYTDLTAIACVTKASLNSHIPSWMQEVFAYSCCSGHQMILYNLFLSL